MTSDFTGKVAVVTGGAGGIGRATAERLVAEGARVVVADVDAGRGQKVAAGLGDRATFKQTDVSAAGQVQALMDFTVDRFGALDVLCNIAGVSGSLRRFLDDDLRDFERVVAVDLFGVIACSRSAALHMVGHGGGAIVNIASGAGVTPGVGMLPYRAAKAGVAHFTRCLAVELGEHGVRANCIAPANIATDINAAFDKSAVTRLQPLPHQGVPDDVVEAALYLAGDRAAHVTGVVLGIDGGMAVGTPPRG
jgi:NAD(P)-dependent dehydrogenase (short-subunit alcohol dehydrogenase family)